jgi:hypothetical protein
MFPMVLDVARPYKKITLSKLNCRESHQGNVETHFGQNLQLVRTQTFTRLPFRPAVACGL